MHLPKGINIHLGSSKHRGKFVTRAIIERGLRGTEPGPVSAAAADPPQVPPPPTSLQPPPAPKASSAVEGDECTAGTLVQASAVSTHQAARLQIAASATQPKPCRGVTLEEIIDTEVGKVGQYLLIWISRGQPANIGSVCLKLVCTQVRNENKVTIWLRCAACHLGQRFLIVEGTPCCSKCMFLFRTFKVAQDVASQAYLILKGDILGYEAR